MKFNVAALVIPALAGQAFAGVAAKRASSDAVSQVSQLVADAKEHVAAINAVATTVHSSSTSSQNATISAQFDNDFAALGNDITGVVKVLQAGNIDAAEWGALQQLLCILLDDTEEAVNDLLKTLGLGALVTALEPLEEGLTTLGENVGLFLDDLLGPGLDGEVRDLLHALGLE